jgi:hypothetical protein
MLVTLVYLLVICAVAALVYWAVDALGTPEPINRIIKVAVVVIAVIAIILLLLRLFGIDAPNAPPLT